jgi:uncharacterized protein
MSISAWVKHHSFLFVGLLEIGAIATFLIASLVIGNLGANSSDADLLKNGIGYAVLTVLTIFLLNRLGWWQETGFRLSYRWFYILLFWLPLLVPALSLLGGLKIASTDPWRIAIFFVVALMIGFVEEGIFRGIMVRALYARGMWVAVIVSSVLFGLSHSINIFLGENPEAVLLQIIYATTIYGFGSAALVIYTGTLLPLIAIHFWIDFSGWLATGSSLQTSGVTFGDVFITVVGSILAIGYGTLLLILAQQAKRGQAN